MDVISLEREEQYNGNILDYMRKKTDSAVVIVIKGFESQTTVHAGSTSFLLDVWRRIFPRAVKNRRGKLTAYFHLVSKCKNAWSYISTPQYLFIARW
jgi:hypothetical protein